MARRSGCVAVVSAVVLAVVVHPGGGGVVAEPAGAVPGTPRGAAAVIAAGGAHSCARLANGTVKCWGSGNLGQLGQGNTDTLGDQPGEMGNNLSAIDLGTGRTATAVAGGTTHTCALLDDGTAKCWGDGGNGQLGQGSTDNIGDQANDMGDNLPAIDLGTGRTATAITAGTSHTCVLSDDGTVKCWGDGGNGRLGQGNTADIGDQPGEMGDNLPAIDLGTGRTATALAAGRRHTCARLDDGTVKCWGEGEFGQLGQGSTDDIGDQPNEMGDFLPPINLGAGRTATAITAGNAHSCALLDNGTMKCWGIGILGRLGQGSADNIGDQPNQMGDNLLPIALGAGALVVPVTVSPAAPVAVTATANSPVTVAWSAPGDNGGAAVTGYRIEQSLDGVTWTTSVADTGSTATSRQIGGLTAGDTVRFRVAAINSVGVGVVSLPSAPVVVASGYLALDPARLLDTRPGTSTVDGLFVGAGKLTGGDEVALQVTGRGGVPADVDAVVLNVTVNETENFGFVTAYPCGTQRPETSNLNYVSGQTIPNTVIVKVGTGGTVCLFSDQTTHLIADVNGAFPTGSAYEALDPARLLDTRPGTSTIDGAFVGAGTLAGGDEIALPVTGRGGVPADADAVVLNVTVNETENFGFVTAYPCGTQRPETSNLNYVPGQTIPNTVIVKVGTGGTVCLFSDQTTHLIADVNGAFPTGSAYQALDPARLLDTRPGTTTIDGAFVGAGKLAGGDEVALPVTGRGAVPADADAVVLNVTVNETDNFGFVTAYPCGTQRPETSNLNYVPGQTIPNTVIVKVGTGGTVCLFSDQTTHLIADVNGAFPAP